ncbi:WD40 repeat-like protein [Gloeophyllum trabeum ATCC 11539]|uniref:WD40 repeat-like protein n=1 Tax=Gloeophyllum trabeum (strain ATCC 11539 / FP-39264 / Madison 617) TaxID=670483 RepID=S7Q3T7_GLOTA|nr:WD40 repeat-like protein [Gloeophyllum trabeum ATCC 11539]EPQ54103.1 WD40 repeat-like protein [Gloeophyllum trabeum ATCC 11539]
MASERPMEDAEEFGEGEEEAYIDQNEVYAEVEVDGDHPMDEEDDGEQMEASGADGIEGDVVYEDTSIQHFPTHQKSVFCVTTHPTAPLAASGGEDDLGYIWDITTGEQIVRLTGHTDSVTCVAFSSDGELLSTGGMDGKVRVWRRVGKEDWKTWEFLTELQGPDEAMWLRWHPKGHVLLAGANDTTVWMWQLPSGNTMQVFVGHTGPVQCGEFTPDGKRIVTADADGTLCYWDPRSSSPVFKLTSSDARFDLGGITSVGINFTSTIAVVGGIDGGVRVVSLSKGDIVGALAAHSEGESIEAVVFVDLTGTGAGTDIVVTGATDGKICIWDLATMRLRASVNHEDAVVCLLAHPPPQSHLIVSASADKTLRTWDARTGTLVRSHKGHHGPVLACALGLDGKVLVSAGDDGVCLVFATE